MLELAAIVVCVPVGTVAVGVADPVPDTVVNAPLEATPDDAGATDDTWIDEIDSPEVMQAFVYSWYGMRALRWAVRQTTSCRHTVDKALAL